MVLANIELLHVEYSAGSLPLRTYPEVVRVVMHVTAAAADVAALHPGVAQHRAGQLLGALGLEAASLLRVAAGGQHSLLLKNNGEVVAYGRNVYGQCDIPALDVSLAYTSCCREVIANICGGSSHEVP